MRTLLELNQVLTTSFANGLTSAAIAQSRQRFGANRLTPLPKEPLWKKFLDKFDEPIIKILLAAALLSMIVDLFRPPLETLRYVAGGSAVALAVLAVVGASLRGRSEWVPSLLFVAALVLFPI